MMPTAAASVARHATGNLILDNYPMFPAVVAHHGIDRAPVTDPTTFSPGYLLPRLDAATRRYFSVATATWRRLSEYHGVGLALLDLTGNPGTNTTKTLPSLLIVARAVEYIRRTGERVVIVTPTSANKGTALRDAVCRALDAGLVPPDRLAVVVIAPATARDKLRDSRLAADADLRARNPVLLHHGGRPEEVKALGRAVVDEHADALADGGIRLWYTLSLDNYVVADAARAFFEHRVAPTAGAPPRLHAHAVSSAFGLLGYHLGRDVLEAAGAADVGDRPGALLVQHLGTPDMVLSLRYGSVDRSAVPSYVRDPADGCYRQSSDPRFPYVTDDPDEVLDATFYTHRPVTSPRMNAIIARHGGDGVVVSRRECLDSYPLLRRWCEELPADPALLREWSLAMALTGVRHAVDRGLVEAGHEVVVHASGCYSAGSYPPLRDEAVVPVGTADDAGAALLRAVGR